MHQSRTEHGPDNCRIDQDGDRQAEPDHLHDDVAREREGPEDRYRTVEELDKEIKGLEKKMRAAAKALEFEEAARVRDRIKTLRATEFGLK